MNYLFLRLNEFEIMGYNIEYKKNMFNFSISCTVCGNSFDNTIRNDKSTLIKCRKCGLRVVILPISVDSNGLLNELFCIDYNSYQRTLYEYRKISKLNKDILKINKTNYLIKRCFENINTDDILDSIVLNI